MTVKAWMTISVVVLALLGGTAAYRFLAPLQPPELLATAGDVRLEGSRRAYCWPERRAERPRCRRSGGNDAAVAMPRWGRIRVVAAYPVSPKGGFLELRRQGGEVVQRVDGLDEPISYDLAPGRYELTAEARYSASAYVRYSFAMKVTTQAGRGRRAGPTAQVPVPSPTAESAQVPGPSPTAESAPAPAPMQDAPD